MADTASGDSNVNIISV